MKRFFIKLIIYLLVFSFGKVFRFLFARRNVTLVNYHNPKAETFANHLAYFKSTYSIISLDDLSKALANKDFSTLPPYPMVITIDDGHAGNFALLDCIKRSNVPITIYLVSGIIGTKKHYWFKSEKIERSKITLLKSIPNKQRISLLSHYGYNENDEHIECHALSFCEIFEMQNAGVSFESHTVSHPILTNCTASEINYELHESRKYLESVLGKPVYHFAYPNGDLKRSVRLAVKNAGYLTARTIEPGFINANSDPLALPNFGISDDAELNKAILQASGFWYFIKYSKKFIRN